MARSEGRGIEMCPPCQDESPAAQQGRPEASDDDDDADAEMQSPRQDAPRGAAKSPCDFRRAAAPLPLGACINLWASSREELSLGNAERGIPINGAFGNGMSKEELIARRFLWDMGMPAARRREVLASTISLVRGDAAVVRQYLAKLTRTIPAPSEKVDYITIIIKVWKDTPNLDYVELYHGDDDTTSSSGSADDSPMPPAPSPTGGQDSIGQPPSRGGAAKPPRESPAPRSSQPPREPRSSQHRQDPPAKADDEYAIERAAAYLEDLRAQKTEALRQLCREANLPTKKGGRALSVVHLVAQLLLQHFGVPLALGASALHGLADLIDSDIQDVRGYAAALGVRQVHDESSRTLCRILFRIRELDRDNQPWVRYYRVPAVRPYQTVDCQERKGSLIPEPVVSTDDPLPSLTSRHAGPIPLPRRHPAWPPSRDAAVIAVVQYTAQVLTLFPDEFLCTYPPAPHAATMAAADQPPPPILQEIINFARYIWLLFPRELPRAGCTGARHHDQLAIALGDMYRREQQAIEAAEDTRRSLRRHIRSVRLEKEKILSISGALGLGIM
ncbi:hypothetical protein F4818DRAFT_454128 [Hypoxylon cercidicola]|nr:hypothetical protein F4818DRAFT_454128 [Hypoxylon cercidicola]